MSGLSITEQKYAQCCSLIQTITFCAPFEPNYGVECCRLGAVMTHLSRWGTAMGFTKVSTSAPLPEEQSEVIMRKTLGCLSVIFRALDGAKEDGLIYGETATADEAKNLDSQMQIANSNEGIKALYVALQRINTARASNNSATPAANTIKIYEKDSFDILIQTVSIQSRRLNDLFPSLKDEQSRLAADEIHTIKNIRGGSILWLKEIVSTDDYFLSEALEQETSNNRDFYTDIIVKEKFKGQFGNRYHKGETSARPTTFKGIVAGGEANVHFGHIYGA